VAITSKMRKLSKVLFIVVPFILYSIPFSFENLSVFANVKVLVNVKMLLLAGAIIIGGCSPAPESPTQSQDNLDAKISMAVTTSTAVTIAFTPHFKGLPIQCEQPLKINNAQWYVSELAMFFSQLSINNTHPIILDDNDWQSQQVALIRYNVDCKKTTVNMSLTGVIEDIEVIEVIEGADCRNAQMPLSLSFNVGVPFAINHQNPLIQASPLNDSSMFWAWRNGYKFIRWDMQNDTGDSWSFHLGSVGCVSAAMVRGPKAPCAQANVTAVDIVLPSNSIQVLDIPQSNDSAKYNAAIKKVHINISIHLDEIIKNMTLTRKTSCMFSGIDNTTCNELVENLKRNAVFTQALK
jgi:uncharacterized repeat protein (TIGR04052 family)